MQTIILASSNQAKLRELQDLLDTQQAEFRPQQSLNIPDAIEDGLSFVENALIKARHAARLSGLPALADDSGLAIDALGGAPGIYSARYADTAGDRQSRDAANNQKVLEALAELADTERRARFHCVIVLLRHAEDPVPLICHGVWEGLILHAPRGTHGFGYDPLFYVPSEGCSAAELSAERKQALSHRGQALRQLREQWPFQ